MNAFNGCGGFPGGDGQELGGIHLDLALAND